MKNIPKEDKLCLSFANEIYALCEISGLDTTDNLKALSGAVARILSQDTPDRQTAYDLRDLFSGAIYVAMHDADANGYAAWSRARMQ